MNLSKTEAYITKTGKIKFGSEDTATTYIVLNPVKGSYKEKKNRLIQILEMNSDCIIHVKFGNMISKWLTQAKVDTVNHKNEIIYYDSYNHAKGKLLIDCTASVGNKWDDFERKVMDLDLNICSVVRKGF